MAAISARRATYRSYDIPRALALLFDRPSAGEASAAAIASLDIIAREPDLVRISPGHAALIHRATWPARSAKPRSYRSSSATGGHSKPQRLPKTKASSSPRSVRRPCRRLRPASLYLFCRASRRCIGTARRPDPRPHSFCADERFSSPAAVPRSARLSSPRRWSMRSPPPPEPRGHGAEAGRERLRFSRASRGQRSRRVACRARREPVSPQALDRIAPWRFRAPLSPDMAASRESSRSIDFAKLVEHSPARSADRARAACC